MSNPILVGIDVHRKTNTVCAMDSQGQELTERFTVNNNRPGTDEFVKHIAELVANGDFDNIHIAAEATSWYWFHFFQALSQDEFLNQCQVSLYPVNPRLTKNFKKTYVDMDHTDTNDAFIVADRLRMGRDLPALFQYDDTYWPLKILMRYRYHVVHNLAREKAHCMAILYLKASEYTRIKPFSDTFGAASQAVLKEFSSIEEVAHIPFDQLVEFIDTKGRRRFPDPTENADKLQQVARNSYCLPEAMQQPIHMILGLSLQHINCLERQQKRLDVAIAQRMESIPQTLETIPGFGPVFSAGIIAEIGNIQSFNCDQAKVAKYAGFKWRRHQSGDFKADESKLTRTGNRYLRYYFCEAANSVRMRDTDYAAFYKRKYNEVRKHQHKRAIVLTARKLVRLVVRLLATNQPYQPGRCSPKS
jgi:transposase